MSYKLAGVIWNEDGTMKQESNLLESFETIKSEFLYQLKERIGDNGELFEEDLTIVETALKEGEKNKKAVEIIKNKKVDIGIFLYCISGEDEDDVKAYNSYKNSSAEKLTQEEYELLKEVLL